MERVRHTIIAWLTRGDADAANPNEAAAPTLKFEAY
jgi:hypothetical protein